MLLVDGREEVVSGAGGFGAAEQQQSSCLEGVMKGGQDMALDGDAQIDEQVAAAEEVDLREGRIFGDIVAGEDAAFANELDDLIAAIDFIEEAAQPIR